MIKVRSKTLFIPAEEQSIGAVGEADSTVREFHIDRVSGDGVDLANLLFKLNIRYAGVRDIDRSDLEKVVTDNAIILRWLISSVTLRNAGTAFLQLDAFDETGSCRWKSYPGAVYIEKSLGNTEVSSNTLSELEQLEKKFAKVGEGESARVEAEKKRVSAEEKREEAEGKRNASLANIIAEEDKIKAVSAETKGYKDSVLADKQEITTMKNEAVSAKAEAQQHASAAEASKTSTITEGTKIKEAVTALKNEVTAAKTDAVNAKNEAVSAKNGANTIKGEVLALKNESNANAEKAKQNADKAEASANKAKTAETNAEAFKTEAGKSADKAKESETKTLEALKKAQEGGKVAGVTADEMHSYVDTAVGKVKSGITETEAIAVVGSELKKKEVPQKDYKALTKTLVSGENSTLENIGENTLVDGKTLSSALSGVAEGTKERFLDKSGLNGAVTPLVESIIREKAKGAGEAENVMLHLLSNPNSGVGYYYGNTIVSGKVLENTVKNIGGFVRGRIETWGKTEMKLSDRIGFSGTSLEVLQRVKRLVKYGDHTFIMPGDYIDLGTTIPGTPSMRFYVMGVDTFGTEPCIDFVSFDYPDKFQMKEGLDHYKPSPIMINASVFGKVFNDKRLAELHEARNKEYISNKTISIFGDDTKQKIDIAFWTLDLSHILGSPILLLAGGSVETTGILPYPLFQKEKFVKALGKGSLITSTTTVNNINIVDLEGYIGSMTKEEAFLEIPEGPNKEAELKKRPIIPICFRIAKTGN